MSSQPTQPHHQPADALDCNPQPQKYRPRPKIMFTFDRGILILRNGVYVPLGEPTRKHPHGSLPQNGFEDRKK